MNTTTNIQQTLRWSEPQQVKTRNGDRTLRTATPTPAFWGAWRSNKPALQQAGLTCRPAEDGAWVVCWWSDPTEPVVVPTSSLPVTGEDIPRQGKDGRLWSEEQMAIFNWFKSGTGSLVVRARTVPHFLTKIRTWGGKQKNRFRSLKDPEPKFAEIDDQVETLVAVAEGASSVKEITSRLSTLFADTTEGSLPAVVLSSVHKAKGLEWDRVFILTQTFRRATEGEEANIYYVAVTRAKNTLIMVHQDRQG